MELIAYDLAELYERQPIFTEQIIRFTDCFYSPQDDPVWQARMVGGTFPTEYLQLVERIQNEINAQEPKNYWTQIKRLAMQRLYRDEMV